MFRDVPGCSGMFRNVPECSGMFHVPGFIDAPAGSPSCGSNVNCKLQTWPQGRGHVTFCGLRFAVSHEKPDAKGP